MTCIEARSPAGGGYGAPDRVTIGLVLGGYDALDRDTMGLVFGDTMGLVFGAGTRLLGGSVGATLRGHATVLCGIASGLPTASF